MRSSCQGEIIFQLSRLNDFSQLKQMMTQLHTSLISYTDRNIILVETSTTFNFEDIGQTLVASKLTTQKARALPKSRHSVFI